jgi:hypothetical protein
MLQMAERYESEAEQCGKYPKIGELETCSLPHERAQRAGSHTALAKTVVSVRRLGEGWGIKQDGIFISRRRTQAGAVIEAHTVARQLRLSGRKVDIRFDGGVALQDEAP